MGYKDSELGARTRLGGHRIHFVMLLIVEILHPIYTILHSFLGFRYIRSCRNFYHQQ